MSEQEVGHPDGQRVNRVTSTMDGEGTRITLYRTNIRLAEVTNNDIGIPEFAETKLPNKQIYVQYCRDAMINLIKNGGVQGYYYDPENRSSNSGLPSKFTRSAFATHAKEIVNETLLSVQESMATIIKTITVIDSEDLSARVVVSEPYPDGHIKYGELDIPVLLEGMTRTRHTIIVPVEIRSGQLCKPKQYKMDDITKNITATNISNIFLASNEVKPTVLKLSGNMVTLAIGEDGHVHHVDDVVDTEDPEDEG